MGTTIIYRHYDIDRAELLHYLKLGMDALAAYDLAISEGANDFADSHPGYLGDLFELAVSYYLNRSEGATVIRKCIKSVYADAKVCGHDIEIKSGCGELPNGKYGFVIYCPEVDINLSVLDQARVFTRDQWNSFLNGYPGRGAFTRMTWDSAHKVQTPHIQSFRSAGRPKASKPMRDYIDAVCESMPSLRKWLGM